ncbi:hypothetical protein PRIC1_003308 [Phytophthora ramorum]
MTSSFDVCKFFFEPVYDAGNPPPAATEPSPPSLPAPGPNDPPQPKKRGRKKRESLSDTSNRHRCRLCSNCYTQAAGTGYTNLLTHLRIKHPDWEDIFKAQRLDTTDTATEVSREETSETCFSSTSLTASTTSSAPKQRQNAGRKRGPVYEHFEDIPSSPGNKQKKMRCVYCHEDTLQLSRRLKLHLVAKCPQAPEDVKAKYVGIISNKTAGITQVDTVTKIDATMTNVDTSVSIVDSNATNVDTSRVVDKSVDVDTCKPGVDAIETNVDATAATLISVAKVDAVAKATAITPDKTRFKLMKAKLQQSPALRASIPDSDPAPQQNQPEVGGDLRRFEEKLATALITTNTPWSLLDNAAFRDAMETLRPASSDFPLTAARARTEVLGRLAQKYDRDCRELLATSDTVTLVVNSCVNGDGTKKMKYMALDEWRRAFVLAENSAGSPSPNVTGVLSVVSTLPAKSASTKLFLCAQTSGEYARARQELLRNARALDNPFTLMGACMTQQTALLLNELVLSSLSLEEALDNAVLTADALHVMPSLRRRVLGDIQSGDIHDIDEDANAFAQVSVTSWRSVAMAVKQATRLEPFLRPAILQEKYAAASLAPSPILRQLLDMGSTEMTWSTLRHTDQLLTPLHFLSALSELQSTTSGQLLALWIWLFGAATRSPLLDGNSDALISSYMQRLACYVEEHFIACLMLDPRVQGAGLSASGLRRARGVTVRVATAMIPGFNENNFIRSYNDYVKQQGDFGEPGVWNAVNTSSPMDFWGDYEGDPLHNHLAVVAKAVCSYVPHSCSIEDLWAAHARPNLSSSETADSCTSKEHEARTKIRHSSSVNARANAMAVVSRFHTLLDVENEQSVGEMLQSNQDAGDQETSSLNVSARSVLQRIEDGLEEDVAATDSPTSPLDATWFDISSAGLDKIRENMENYLSAAMQQ